ncbi:MAG: 2-oxoacid:acceptor oxidoreductase subunit alpha [Ignavibacteriaceae bacterium]|jgi:2-oxoglutarate ferredoxin oxidoreductase subunit alpha|nr:MAG: 2-oxoacid:acceptor oxidoreductase subunit alpha [Chlorobiota bacterium]MBV6399299.1 2-oxoglutarate oxidoreductase subunit KorA [Ignavibacteria bacterium]MCC6884972.1 2-oxoacid:acceptor oxidoreductase subunit alpha [Ignavibacteriales bacterium]MCE7953497.1 2-oxoacid:acceptor oxidoreductase subunit alpha [Chlorobi bacterium CHB7]MDL1887613.1 2-oxoacid:acceptor oxidoreductase subunit alpha [Ignavibacteria bacterium CHB1]MEB2329259.1 2-oxoacid:acceptor oxidoreductase subunit alpha [Ignavib
MFEQDTESLSKSLKKIRNLNNVTVRFAGDSGDGMQLTGNQFTDTVAIFGNDLGTLPDFPAEIRAPIGTTYGVSGFQLQFSDHEIYTPGDEVDLLVAMNPAALKVNIRDLKKGGDIIVNSDSFDKKNLQLAGYETNPLEDDSLSNYKVHSVPITKSTLEVLKDLNLSMKVATKCKNFFALGIMLWLYNRSIERTINWITRKFKNDQIIAEANIRVLKAGYNFGETAEIFTTRYEIKPAKLRKGIYRNINGNDALSLGLIAGSVKSGLDIFLGSYPITPASDILHFMSRQKKFGVITFQAEDEIAGITSAIGASFAGKLGVTTTSGPGMALKTEAMGFAVMTELPLVIVDVQRGGPSTGLPTKTEQADLLQSVYGRNSEAPIPVLAAATPADCFNMAFEAVRIALRFMTPVILLSDGYLANGSEPWKTVRSDELMDIEVNFRTEEEGFFPYLRDEMLARPWAIPGTKGLEHRIGGLEKKHITGNVNYEPENHELMVKLRAQKVKNIENFIPDLEVNGHSEGKLLILGWGSTQGPIIAAVEKQRAKGNQVSMAHLKYLNPLPKNTADVLRKFESVLIPEMNLGQLSKIIRSEFLINAISLNKVQGLPFKAVEIETKIEEILNNLK